MSSTNTFVNPGGELSCGIPKCINLKLLYTVWRPGTGENRNHWQCLACDDGRWHPTYNAKRHEGTQSHITQLRHWQRSANWVAPNPLESNPRVNSLVNDSIVELLGELQDHRPHNSPSPPPTYYNDSDIEMDAPQSDREFLQTQDPTHYSVSFNDSDTT